MQITCSPKMLKLFARAFEGGIGDPTQRPSMNEWREVLETASDALITCPDCGSDYFFHPKESECRFCDESQPEAYYAYIKNWEPLTAFNNDEKVEAQLNLFNSKLQTQGGIIVGGAKHSDIRLRHIQLIPGNKGRESLMTILTDGQKATIDAVEIPFWLSRDLKETSEQYTASTVLPLKQLHGLSIHFLPLTEPQRIIHIRKLS